MKKLFISTILASFLFGGVALAEESGTFIGVGVGYGGDKLKVISGETVYKWRESGVSYGLVVGYKQFFTESFGLRYYVNVDMLNTKISGEEMNETLGFNNLNYGANIDVLYNFIASSNIDFGAFLGLGLGANTWSGSGITSLKAEPGVSKVTTTSFDVALNVGLRTNFLKYHGIEILARVPFIPTTLFNGNVGGGNALKVRLAQNYNAMLRYTFSF